MMIENKKNWLTEFKEFLEIDAMRYNAPKTFFTKIKSRLFPNPWIVFGKITLVHAVFGLLSLSVCSQFGLNPFITIFSLSDWLLKVGGQAFCMHLCGIFFMVSTYTFSNLFLTFEQLQSVKRHKWLQTGVFGLASLAVFYFFGATLVVTFTILWLSGVLIGGVLSVELSYRLRRIWI